MSRYVLKAKRSHMEVAVGWDRPLQSLFWDVFNNSLPEDSEGHVVLTSNLGRPRQHLTDIQVLVHEVKPFVDLTLGEWTRLKSTLLLDMANS
jgi:hypothetical protein